MRTTCLVNNYNYCQFVGEAVVSALEQSTPFDEIIVVDDGSTDGSLSSLRREFATESRVEIVAKANEGQLSAFNEGMRHAAGDVLFFLDADDRYRNSYLQTAMAAYDKEGADFVIAGVETFGPTDGPARVVRPQRDLGYSALATLLDGVYVGGPTSALSMRRTFADEVLPYPVESDWRTRADDVLVLGASIVGARKFHLGAPLVEYRLHGGNNFSGQHRDAEKKYHHGLAVNRLIRWYAERSGYDLLDLARLLHREFATIERPTLGELQTYLWISWRAKIPLRVRARHWGEMTQHYVMERLGEVDPPRVQAEVEDSAATISISQERRAA